MASLIEKIKAYRSHQSHASTGSQHYLTVEKDFDQVLDLAGLLELKNELLSSEVREIASSELDVRVEGELSKWARARGCFIQEKECLINLQGVLSRARSRREFLSRAQLEALLSPYLIDPLAHVRLVRSQLDSPAGFRELLRARGDTAARIEDKLILAEAYESQNDFVAAVRIYEALIIILDDVEWLLIRCAALNELLDDIPKAEANARRALSLNPRAFGALCVLGTIAGQDNRFDDALGYFYAAESVNANVAGLLHNIGYTLMRKGSLEGAIEYFEKATAAPDATADSFLNKGIVLFNLGVFHKSQEAIEMALRLEPNMPQALSQLGEVHRYCGRLDEAISLFTRALQAHPDNSLAKLGIAISMLENSDPTGARQLVIYFADRLKENPIGMVTPIADLGLHRTFIILITRIDEHNFEVKCDTIVAVVSFADTSIGDHQAS